MKKWHRKAKKQEKNCLTLVKNKTIFSVINNKLMHTKDILILPRRSSNLVEIVELNALFRSLFRGIKPQALRWYYKRKNMLTIGFSLALISFFHVMRILKFSFVTFLLSPVVGCFPANDDWNRNEIFVSINTMRCSSCLKPPWSSCLCDAAFSFPHRTSIQWTIVGWYLLCRNRFTLCGVRVPQPVMRTEIRVEVCRPALSRKRYVLECVALSVLLLNLNTVLYRVLPHRLKDGLKRFLFMLVLHWSWLRRRHHLPALRGMRVLLSIFSTGISEPTLLW